MKMLYALALLALAAFSHAKNLPLTAEGAAVAKARHLENPYGARTVNHLILEVAWMATQLLRARTCTLALHTRAHAASRTWATRAAHARAPAASQNELRAPGVSHLPRIACQVGQVR